MYIISKCSKLRNDDRGSVVVIFSICAILLFVVVGAAVDLGRWSTMKTATQNASDSAILAVLKDKSSNQNMTLAKMEEKARELFDANMRPHGRFVTEKFAVTENGGNYELNVEGHLQTTLMRLANLGIMNISTVSAATMAGGNPLEVALVLDTTQSMDNDGKIDALRVAATDMVDTLMTGNGPPVKIAVVPFQDYVNVGMANRNRLWIDVPADSDDCYDGYPQICKKVSGTCTNDSGSYACQVDSCKDDTSKPYGPQCNSVTWQGCVGSREATYRNVDGKYNISKIPGVLGAWCSTALTPLTKKKGVVKKAIQNMWTGNNTYIPSGLTWGWYVLSNKQPFRQATKGKKMANKHGTKAIVLMTDGSNTATVQYGSTSSLYVHAPGGDHWKSDPTGVDANAKTLEICAAIKNDTVNKIIIHTVAFKITDNVTKDMLKKCAQDTGGSYHDAGNSAELKQAFGSISGTLGTLRLVR